MNISEIKSGMKFITSALPVDRAVLCGIQCIDVEIIPDADVISSKGKVTFKRLNRDEQFSFFANPAGEIEIGKWIPYEIKETL